ncbi:MAG: glycerol-3-phosphate dehydrogenase, partial [Hyphomicrobiales bacterium]|nr:glycerol-3-phosphate dehydrogenase [Hyphomicrobiales bacterium]
PAWTRTATLPGGDIPVTGFDDWVEAACRRYPFLERDVVRRLCRAYGTRIDSLMSGASAVTDLGQEFGAGLTTRELDYLRVNEWAETAEDVLWRRSKLGLHLDQDQHAAVASYMQSASQPPASSVRATG